MKTIPKVVIRVTMPKVPPKETPAEVLCRYLNKELEGCLRALREGV